MAYEDIRVDSSYPVSRIIIDRGDGRNALRPQTLMELGTAMDQLSGDPQTRAIILTGAGKHFSAGAEFEFLTKLTKMTASDIQNQIYTAFQGAVRRIYQCPKPTIAAINGSAVTVGCELALACDFRLLSSTAKLQESWIRLGLTPPLGGLYLLPRMVGLARASDIALTGRPVSAQEAVDFGLATELLEDESSLATRAEEFAQELAALPPLAYRSVKEGLHRGMESSMSNEWATSVLAQSLLLGTEDFREGLAAAVERRPGKFVGK